LNSDLLRVIPMHTLHGFAGEFRFEPVHRFDRLFVNPRRRWTISAITLSGTYVAVEPFHLHRYLDEAMFRYNNRGTKDNPLNDADQFDAAVRQIVGKRITYKELTGKSEADTVPF
jgi:hypothetical protein